MFLTLITFITALAISSVAIYYSVAGLAAIFAAAVIPIIIMGGTLEIAKLVTTVWLHRYWNQARWWLKTYLTVAVVVLMFITSMGIFGFLSKAHIEQTTASEESVAQVEQMTKEIARQREIIERAEARVKQIETTGVGGDSNVQSQIQQEQGRIDSAYSRAQPAIDEQQRIIDSQTKIYSDAIAKIDEQSALLQRYIDAKEIDKAQALVGVKSDGDWGPATARAVTTWKDARTRERTAAVAKLEEANTNPTIKSARDEILRIRKTVETQLAESNRLVNRLRDQLGKTDSTEVDRLLTEQQDRIRAAQKQSDELTQKKYQLEGEYRKLEAEVGPIKYIAAMIYGENTDSNTLEKAVSWLIIIIIFVFDPLAILLLLASQYSYEYHRSQRKEPEYEADDGPLTDSQLQQIKTANDILQQDVNSSKPEDNIPLVEPTTREIELANAIAKYEEEQNQLHKLIDKLEEQVAVKLEVQEQTKQVDEPIEIIQEPTFTQGNYALGNVVVGYGNFGVKNIGQPTVDSVDEHIGVPVTEEERIAEVSKLIAEETLQATEPLVADTQVAIETDNVTKEAIMYHPDQEYVSHEGKVTSINALRSSHPELILSANDPVNQILFGNQFPQYSRVGDIYIRTDAMPHRVYKFNGKKWINVDKLASSTYLQSIPYVNYLIAKLESGEYPMEMLTEMEREDIAEYLENK